MKKWFRYKLKNSTGSRVWYAPNEELEKHYGEMNFTYMLGIGEGHHAINKNIIGWIDCNTASDLTEIAEDLKAQYKARQLTITEAKALLEYLTGWTVTINGDNLEATVNGQNYVW